MELLVYDGADINEEYNGGYTPLFWACIRGHVEIVKYLVDKGANTKIKDASGKTPLDRARKGNCKEIIAILSRTQYRFQKLQLA